MTAHEDVIKLKHFPCYWLFVRGIHWSPVNMVNCPHKSQWRGALMISMICAWINGSVNNRCAGDLRRHRAHYDVTIMRVLHVFMCTFLWVLFPLMWRMPSFHMSDNTTQNGTANMSWRTCVVVKQIQSNQPTLLIPHHFRVNKLHCVTSGHRYLRSGINDRSTIWSEYVVITESMPTYLFVLPSRRSGVIGTKIRSKWSNTSASYPWYCWVYARIVNFGIAIYTCDMIWIPSGDYRSAIW